MLGLYYGFLTALALKISYIFLIRAMVRENQNHKAASITGLILGQLGRFLSIYYAPLYITFGRPYTLTVITLVYFLVNLFGNNVKKHASNFGAYGNAVRTLELHCIFLNNLMLQLLNLCIFPSSTLARLVNVYLFRCNNKMVFLISSFSGWLIGQLLVLKGCQLILEWGQNKNSIRTVIHKDFVKNSMLFICLFGSILFILTIQTLGRISFPLPTQKLSTISRIERREEERLKKTDVAKEEKLTEDEEELSQETDILKNEACFKLEDEYLEKDIEQAMGTLLFDYKRWTRPFRYIKNNQFEQTVRNEMSQYFFSTQQSDGKSKIHFTQPLNLSILSKSLSFSFGNKHCLDINWVEKNKKKINCLKMDLLKRIQNLDNILGIEFGTTRTRLYIQNYETKNEYLQEEYEPLLTGSARSKINQETETKNDLFRLDPSIKCRENKTNNQFNPLCKDKLTFEEIRKTVPRWSYKLITELEQLSYYRNPPDDHDIRTRKARSFVVFDPSKHPNMKSCEDNPNNYDSTLNNKQIQNRNSNSTDKENTTKKEPKDDKRYSIRYSYQSDFRHGLIKDSMRPLRRKIVIIDLFEGSVHSPLFVERRKKKNLFSLLGLIKLKQNFRTWSTTKKFEVLIRPKKQKTNKEKKRQETKEQIEIAEAWDTFELTQALRGFLLITQSSLRKNIILPSLIIFKNIGRILFLQNSEWFEDFEELEKETHIPCTYNGIPLGEKEFPRNWLTEGIQIKILSPFCLKPWNDKKQTLSASQNFCFLTIWGQETNHIFGRPIKKTSFFKPVFIELENRLEKIKISKEKRKLERNLMNEGIKDPLTLKEPFNQFTQHEKFQVITTRTNTIKKNLEKITAEKKKLTPKLTKRFYQKSLKKKQNELIYNFYFFNSFIQFFIQKIYNVFLFYTVLNCQLINQLISETRANLISKRNSTNDQKKKGKKKINEFSQLSQAYVFYKILQQKQIFNLRKLRFFLNNDQKKLLFIKKKITEFFFIQIQTEIKNKNLIQVKINQWKNWLQRIAQYDLSQIFCKVNKKKWQNKLNIGKIYVKKWPFKEILKFTTSKKVNGTNLRLKEQNFEKCYRYDLLCSKFINFKKKPVAFFDQLPISLSKRQRISCNINMLQNSLFALTKNIGRKNLMEQFARMDIPYIEKNIDRKFLSSAIISFSIKKKQNIELWIPLTSKSHPKQNDNYEVLEELELLAFINQIFKTKKFLIDFIEKKTQSNSKNFLIDCLGLNQKLLNKPVTNLEFWLFPEVVILFDIYNLKPWIIQTQLLLSNLCLKQHLKKSKNQLKRKPDNQKNEEVKNKQKTKNQENSEIEEDPQLAYIKSFLKNYLLFQLRGEYIFNKSSFKNIQILCLLLRLRKQNNELLSSIKRQNLNFYIMPEIGIKELTLEVLEDIGVPEFLKEKALNFEPILLSINKHGKFLMYQLVNLSIVNKRQYKYPMKKKEQIMKTKNKKIVDFIIPEQILSSRRRRQFRILFCLNSNVKKWKDTDTNLLVSSEKCKQLRDQQKKKIDLFLWPNSRLEDLACMNRYWFYTNNGSCFSMLRILMYLPLKIF